MSGRMFLRALILALAAGLGIGMSRDHRPATESPNQIGTVETRDSGGIRQRTQRCAALADRDREAIGPHACAFRPAPPRLFRT